jgi:GNAT superfamily N-acetyltransferase
MPQGLADLRIEAATAADAPVLLAMITALAEYERLSDQVVATEESLRASLFGEPRVAEAVIASVGSTAVGFALYFHNYSTFIGRAGLYLEDLFVLPEWRRRGIGRALLRHVARAAVSRRCGRMEWSVLDWNRPAIDFYLSVGAVPQDAWTVHRLTGDALERLAADAG